MTTSEPSESAEERPTQQFSLADEQIVERVRLGELQLFEILMRRYNQRVFRVARSIVRRDDEAEDVMQEAYVRAYEHLNEFEGRSRFSTWLTRIAVHEAFARVRRQRRFESLESEDLETQPVTTQSAKTPEQHASDGELHAALEKAIDELPDEFRSVFVLRAIEQMSGAETAECLGIPEQTVKTRLHRARLKLQEQMLSAFETNLTRTYELHLSRCDRVVATVLQRVTNAKS